MCLHGELPILLLSRRWGILMGSPVIHTKNTSAGALHIINILGMVSEIVEVALLNLSHPLKIDDMVWEVVSQHPGVWVYLCS